MRRARFSTHPRSKGQGLVEFALVLVPFLLLLMGLVDLGRGIYVNNGVAQAAREIARTTSVHLCVGSPCSSLSPETQATIATQEALVPGMTDASVVIDCVDIADNQLAVTAPDVCPATSDNLATYVRVKVTVPFSIMTPFLPLPKDFSFSSVSHMQIP